MDALIKYNDLFQEIRKEFAKELQKKELDEEINNDNTPVQSEFSSRRERKKFVNKINKSIKKGYRVYSCHSGYIETVFHKEEFTVELQLTKVEINNGELMFKYNKDGDETLAALNSKGEVFLSGDHRIYALKKEEETN